MNRSTNSDDTPVDTFSLADRARVQELVRSMARRIAGTLAGEFYAIGIRRRGAPLAQMLASDLEEYDSRPEEVSTVKLKRYRDDLTVLHEQPKLEQQETSFEVRNKVILLVDDVAYSGRTLLEASFFLMHEGARRIYTAVLCRREEPEVPLYLDFVGCRLDVGDGNIVDVHMPPYEEELGIVVRRR